MKHCKKPLTRLLVLLLCLGLLSQNLCLAAEGTVEAEEAGEAIVETETDDQSEPDAELEDDPGYIKWLEQQAQYQEAREQLNRSTEANANPYTGLVHTHAAAHGGKELLYGIDVSHHQSDINWKKVKKAGIEFVFIRCGYTGYGTQSDFRMAKDSKFETFIQGAHDAGLRIGIYYFSQATSKSEAKQEAEKTLEILEPYKDWITLPVVCDYEPSSQDKYRIDSVSYANATTYIAKYCELVEKAGYDAAYYSYREFLNSLTLSSLSNYDCWVAQFSTSTSYANEYDFWQYSSTGTVDGINGAIDCDFWYHNTTQDGAFSAYSRTSPGKVTNISKTEATDTTVSLSWKASSGASSYQVSYATSSGGSYKTFGTVTKTSCKVTGLKANTNYYFKVTAANETGNAQTSAAFAAATTEAVSEANPVVAKPAKVTGLTKVSATTTSIKLKWTKVSGATKYQVRMCAAKDGTFTKVKNVAGTSATVTGLEPNTGYYFKVRAYNESGWGSVSTALNAETAPGEAYLMYNTSNLNLRSGAGTSNKVLVVVPKYTVFNVTVKQADASSTIWYKAKYTADGKSYTGYLCGTYITTGPRGRTTKKVTIRKKASSSAEAVTNLAASKKLTILSSKTVSGTAWYQIAIKKSGKLITGYVPAQYVEKY